jgi:hypothetical protein
MKVKFTLKIAGILAVLASVQTVSFASGMPAEQRDTIHGLFDAHKAFSREVIETDEGYISKTTSKDPQAVKLLQTHVKQMEGRLKDGLMVRGWDPAYVEFVNHYDDIDIQITNIENGISIVAIGKTPEAKMVARNHAGIVSQFINHGWKEHDKTHAAVYGESSDAKGKMGMKSCCQTGAKESAQNEGACCAGGEGGCAVEGNAGAEKGPGMSCCQKAG